MNLVTATNLKVHYKGAQAASLKKVTFTIESGRATLFLGRSGSGKTTLLKCVAQINTDYEGDLSYDSNLTVGFVAQQLNLFPQFTVLENCVHPQIHVLGKTRADATATADHIFDQLEIAHLKLQRPQALSGGQAQRAAIARALCMNSQLLLLDEPTSALDPQSTQQLATVLKQLLANNITIALSTHDMAFAKQILDRVYFMENGEIVTDPDKIAQFLA